MSGSLQDFFAKKDSRKTAVPRSGPAKVSSVVEKTASDGWDEDIDSQKRPIVYTAGKTVVDMKLLKYGFCVKAFC